MSTLTRRAFRPTTRRHDIEGQTPCSETDPEFFFPAPETPKGARLIALLFCDNCAVRRDCLNDALSFPSVGIWAGTTTEQRQGMVKT